MPDKDFFMSYADADRQWAEWIAWCLEEAGSTTTRRVFRERIVRVQGSAKKA